MAAVLEGEPEGEVAAALGVLGVGENDGALSGPIQSRTNTADGGPEYDEPPGRENRQQPTIPPEKGRKVTYSVP